MAAEVEEERLCRYCFEGEDEGELISPCRCSGGQRWVHLACLKRWQRGVLAGIPAHYGSSSEKRQRICNICNSPFSIAPPTHLEILTAYTGREAAELVAEGSFIVSRRGFTRELRRQLRTLPSALRDTVEHRHWIRGAFLIVHVLPSGTQMVTLRIESESDLRNFSFLIQAGWRCDLHERPFRVAIDDGALASCALAEDADVETCREAVRSLRAPVSLALRSAGPPDAGEDGVIGVNLMRDIDVKKSMHRHKRALFLHARQQAAESFGDEAVRRVPVRHFLGGPCDEEEISCCLVICNESSPSDTPKEGLLRLAQSMHQDLVCAYGAAVAVLGNLAGQAEPSSDGTSSAVEKLFGGRAGGMERSASEGCLMAAGGREHASSRAGLGAQEGEAVQLLIFWGSAGWSRKQLLGEIARGSWGLCTARSEDVARCGQASLWPSLCARSAVAPPSDLSEAYARGVDVEGADSSLNEDSEEALPPPPPPSVPSLPAASTAGVYAPDLPGPLPGPRAPHAFPARRTPSGAAAAAAAVARADAGAAALQGVAGRPRFTSSLIQRAADGLARWGLVVPHFL